MSEPLVGLLSFRIPYIWAVGGRLYRGRLRQRYFILLSKLTARAAAGGFGISGLGCEVVM